MAWNLVTAEMDKRVGEPLEKRLQVESSGEVIILDFNAREILDYSCADEIVAKLISQLSAGEYGERYLLPRGLDPMLGKDRGGSRTETLGSALSY